MGENKKKGRKSFIASDLMREEVRSLAQRGLRHVDIAVAIGCSVPTLRKTFRAELRSDAVPLLDVPDQRSPSQRRKKNGGRPPRHPTPEENNRVSELIATGFTVAQIAAVLNASEPWVRMNFASQIETGAAIKRADVVRQLFKTAARGNVTAQRALVDMIDRAELAKLQREMGEPAPKPEALGKKQQARIDAANVMNDSDWAGLINPAQAN